MRVLLVTYEFPPRGGPGVQRPLKLAKYLGEFGWDVGVLTVEDPPTALLDDTLLDELPGEVEVLRSWSLEPTRLLQALRRGRRGQAGSAGSGSGGGSVKGYSGAPSGIVRLVQGLFVPDEKRYWKPWAVRRAIAALAGDTAPDIVVSSGPPHTAHLVASTLASRFRVPHVLDLRDPWVGYFAATYLTPFHRWLDERIERRVVQQAAAVVTVSRAIADDYRARYPGLAVHVIPNGYDPADLPEARFDADGTFTISYTGTFSGSRTPETFFQGVARAEAQNPALGQETRVVMAGVGAEAEEQARRAGVRSVVEALGYVPHSRSLELLASADVALLILSDGEESRVSLSGKVFEYIGLRRPVLAVVGEGEAADLVRGLAGGQVARFDDPDDIARAILAMHRAWRNGELSGPTPDQAAEYSRIRQAERWSRLLGSLVEGTSP